MTFLLHKIGDKKLNRYYNTPEEIERTRPEDILTFDGVYESVWNYYDILKNKKVILFIIGDYVGKDNKFDKGQPYERFCTWDQIWGMKEMGAQIGWHSRTHRNLTKLNLQDKIDELIPSFKTDLLSYPYGKFDNEVLELLPKMNYQKAYAVNKGDNSQYQILRRVL